MAFTEYLLRHIIQLFLALDGNFRLQKKKKNDDPDDVALMDGHAYFPHDATFRDYIKRVGDSKEVHHFCLCSDRHH